LLQESEFQGGDLIRYRTLSRADFRGTAPSGPAADHADKVGAQTFSIVKHDPGVGFAGKQTTEPNGEKRIVGKIENLRFRAWMDRSRSWWNPKPGGAPESYVLQHEQIHFALVEIEAGVMNEEGKKLMKRTFESDDDEELQADVEAAINSIVKEGMERLLETSRDFDEDTSARYDPKKQSQWWHRVRRQLSAQN
jgi:hypothetical protein